VEKIKKRELSGEKNEKIKKNKCVEGGNFINRKDNTAEDCKPMS
jgi:hypothetical protein